MSAPGRTRERILDAALDLFAENGFAETSIAAIERQVGLVAGTGGFHRHFRSKEELLHAAIEREVAKVMAEIEAAQESLPPASDPREALAQHYAQTLIDIRRFDRLFRVMLTEGDRLPELRTTFARAIGFDDPASWEAHADIDTLVAIAALAGYHYLGLLQGRSYQEVSPGTFIDALVRLTAKP